MTKEIPLSQKRVAIVDDDRYDELSGFNWTAIGSPSRGYYAGRWENADGRKQLILMHRVILGATTGQEVDHIDNDKLNNVRSNLRFATHQQNSFNRKKFAKNRYGFKGVRRANSKWTAQIRAHGIQYYLGVFTSPEEAAHAYDVAAMILHGEFASLNFPSVVVD